MGSLLKKPSAWIPIAIPLALFTFALVTVAFFGIVREKDEGVGAHFFQLWLVFEPFMLGYFAARYLPRMPRETLLVLMLQVAAALMPIAIVFSLKL